MKHTIKINEIPVSVMVLFMLVISFLALLPSWLNYDIISRDGAFQYIPSAILFLQGELIQGLSRPQLPLFPIIIAVVSKISGLDLETSGRVVSVICFMIASVGLFKVSDFVFKDKALALIAVFFFITNRELVERSVDCLKESLLICLIIWGNYFIISGITGAKSALRLCAGFFIILLGGMVRSTALLFFGAWLILWVFHKKRGIVARGGFLIIPAVLVVILWLVFPEFPIFKKSFNLSLLFENSYAISDKISAAIKIIANFFSTGNPAVILMGCLGFYFYKHRDNYFLHLVFVLVIFLIILVMWGFTSDRYLLAPIVWMYPLAAYTTKNLFISKNRFGKIFAILTILSAIILWADKSFTPPDPDKLARKEAGQYILAQIGPDQDVITNRDRLAFYAGARYVPLVNTGDIKNSLSAIAVDVEKDEGEKIKEHLDALGKKPDQVFRTIYVYIPKS